MQITINGRPVQVGDNFKSLTLEQQNATVDEIAAAMAQQQGEPSPETAYADIMRRAADPAEQSTNVTMAQPIKAQPNLIGATSATLGGIVNGIPIIGPMAQNTTDAMIGAGSMLFGKDYNETVQGLRDRRAQIAAANPVADFAGNLAGGVGSFMGAGATKVGAEALGMTGKLLPQMWKSGASTLGIGTVDNMVRGQAPIEAMTNAVAPAAIASTIPVVGSMLKAGGKAVGNALTNSAQRKATDAAIKGAEGSSGLRQAASDLFTTGKGAGVAVKGERVQQVAADLVLKAKARDIDPVLDGEAVALYQRLIQASQEAIQTGEGVSLGRLHNLRQMANDVVQEAKKDRTKGLAKSVIEAIDGMISGLKATDMYIPPNRLVQGAAADYRQAGNDLLAGISTWARAKKVGLVEEALYRAQNAASGFENGLRVEFRKLLNNKSLRSQFTEAELEAFRKVANGTTISNISRLLGAFGFDIGGSSRNMLGGAVGAMVGGIPGAVGASLARKASEKLTQRAAERAAKVVATPNVPIVPRRDLPQLPMEWQNRIGAGARGIPLTFG